ncbi:MAG: Gfo/Idh/MocA family oxidoreductase [Actinomycetota bacterium]|nr:Gfo/Idh/MocA family oxidoreductase [Actinomycetota bacterium]
MPGAVVVGTGFGCRVHVPALRNAGFTVRALVGRDAPRTQRRADRLGVPRACTSLHDALVLDDVDAVTIATPPDTHAALAIEACEAGRHVVCEKPFALDAAEAGRMLAAAQRAEVTHLVGHEFRWAPDRALVARAIAQGAIGEPRMFSVVQYVPLVADPASPVPEWWFDVRRGGGWLGASGSHVVDQVRTWVGEIASVSAALPIVSARDGGAEDSFVVRVTTRRGAQGVLQQTAASWTPHVVGVSIVAGTEGTIEVTGEGVFCSDRGGRRALPVPSDLAGPTPPTPSGDPRERYTHLELGPYTRLAEALRAGVEGRPPDSAVVPPTFVDGLAEMRVLDAIRASAAAGGALVAPDG